MTNITNKKLECIICDNRANYEFQCQHHLCKNCYKVDNFCLICDINVKITPIIYPTYTHPTYTHTTYVTNITNIAQFASTYNVLRIMSGLGSFQYTS